jgi:thiol-disulfide isomerase/thioredoxin
VVLIDFWASWRLPCLPELKGLQALYDEYGDRVDFYLITDEEREPVEAFMAKNGFTFPVTYLIIGEPTPVLAQEPPRSYLIDKNGYVVIDQEGIASWDSSKVRKLLDSLLAE